MNLGGKLEKVPVFCHGVIDRGPRIIKALREENKAKEISIESKFSKDFPNKLPTARPPMDITPFISPGEAAYT